MIGFPNILAWLHWNPPREAFTIPLLDRPIAWYGILFVLGFSLGYALVIPSIRRAISSSPTPSTFKDQTQFVYWLADRLCWFVILGTIIGARLGAVFFYDWPYFRHHLWDIVKVWEGGLSSHGGAIGIIIAIYLYLQYIKKWAPSLTYIKIMDIISPPVALTGCLIRLGNFINQEILGIPSTLPWAVIFENPADGSFPIPRHPVQLYEAAAYLLIFFALYFLNKRFQYLPTGTLFGLLLLLVFTSRFILEFWKSNQEATIDTSYLQMGQWLSLPFILMGIIFLWPLFHRTQTKP